ncbi:hypothetical protein GDO78_019030 [Eleutherodactylus coqui]|uniref:Uncharacterized protein n=1 Tax=Eleutherodactylus coqui TaxID=57060 RepID=A0A8J6JZU0_ELECQ|nr:hypothetical protein GDO78_019030 [Eleutherodactylus coqui]
MLRSAPPSKIYISEKTQLKSGRSLQLGKRPMQHPGGRTLHLWQMTQECQHVIKPRYGLFAMSTSKADINIEVRRPSIPSSNI